MQHLTYRNATLPDLSTIVHIYNSTIATRMVTADLDEVSVESKMPWFMGHNPTTRPLWMVETLTGETIGWVSFGSFYGRPAYNATAEVSIYLAEEQRGKGYGKTILQHCMESAPALGIKTMLGYIFAHNTPSLRLFHDLGFSDWGTLPNIAELDGVERSLIIVGRRLTA